MRHLFASDLHLSVDRPAMAAAFTAFLSSLRPDDRLYLLGDVFDYWIGDDDLDDAFNQRMVQAMALATARGVQLQLMHGNRDFLLGARFCQASGVRLLPDLQRLQIDQEAVLLCHGDLLCTDDVAYQQFRAQVRTPQWAVQFQARALSERRQEVAALRQRNESEKQGKSEDIMDTNAEAVAALLRAEGYPTLVHGHTHRAGRHQHVVDGHDCQRWVLADWYQQPSALLRDDQGWRTLALPG